MKKYISAILSNDLPQQFVNEWISGLIEIKMKVSNDEHEHHFWV